MDEYLCFYFKYIEPHKRAISLGASDRLFEAVSQHGWESWLGIAFERFCLKYAVALAKAMNFSDEVINAAPYFNRGKEGFQIDLLYERTSKIITLCEIKFHHAPISTKIIPEVEKKCNLFPLPRGYTLEKALVSLYGPDAALHDSEYFHHQVTLENLL